MADKKAKLKKLLAFKEDAGFAIFDETLQTNDTLEEVQNKQEEILGEVKNGNTRLDKQDETIGLLTKIAQKEPPTPVDFPTEIVISNQISTTTLEEKIDGVVSAINNKVDKTVNLTPLVKLLEDIKKKRYPEFSTKDIADSVDSLAMEIKADRLVDKTQPENPQLEKKFEELIKKIEALIKAGGLGGKKSIIGGWGSDTVTITSSALPTGASTSENQTTQIANEATLIANTTVGTLSPENSSTTPLGIGGVFTGTAVDTKDFVTVNVVLIADVTSATNGLSLQFSTDGTNWDILETHTISAGVGIAHLTRAKARYFRVVYTNGAIAQTYFRIATLLKNTAVSQTYEKLSLNISDDHDASVVRAVIAGKKPNGDYTNVKTTAGGNIKVSIEEQDAGAGLATSANQDTANTSLALIKAKTDNLDVLLSSRTSQTVNQPTTLEDINISLKNLLNAFVRPIWVEPTVGATTPRLNINTCSVVTTLSIVSGYAMPTSFASASSTQAGITQTQVYSTDRINWQQNIRSRIT